MGVAIDHIGDSPQLIDLEKFRLGKSWWKGHGLQLVVQTHFFKSPKCTQGAGVVAVPKFDGHSVYSPFFILRRRTGARPDRA